MAVTSRKDENGNIVNSTQYQPSQQVQQAQQQMQKAQTQQPGAYQPGQQVQQAQQQMQQNLANKPQGYTSKYGAALDGILQQIQGPKNFKYDFNGDELFKYYADLYTQKGRQASMDAMGQAAALTGGYGNSYAQQVGNQAYDQYLLNLYDKGLEFRDRAYQQHQDQIADLYNQYGVLNQQDQTDYGRYRDTVGDWENERDYLTNVYNNERNFDYGAYRDTMADWMNNRDYYTNVYNNERNFDYGQYTDSRNFDEQVRQFNESLNWEKMSSDQKYAAEYAMQILANGQMPSEEMLMAAGLTPEDAAKLMAQLAPAGGGGGPRKKTGDTTGTDIKPLAYDEARQIVLQNTPLNLKVSDISNNKKDNRTLAELYASADKYAAKRAGQAKETMTKNISPAALKAAQDALKKNKK